MTFDSLIRVVDSRSQNFESDEKRFTTQRDRCIEKPSRGIVCLLSKIEQGFRVSGYFLHEIDATERKNIRLLER